MYRNQTFHNLQSGLSLAGAFTHEIGVDKNNITTMYDCTAYVDDHWPITGWYISHAISTGNKYVTIINDCTAYVDDPDSAGSFANGLSLAGASTYAVGTGNKNIILNFS